MTCESERAPTRPAPRRPRNSELRKSELEPTEVNLPDTRVVRTSRRLTTALLRPTSTSVDKKA
jgi:hypothetical protein